MTDEKSRCNGTFPLHVNSLEACLLQFVGSENNLGYNCTPCRVHGRGAHS